MSCRRTLFLSLLILFLTAVGFAGYLGCDKEKTECVSTSTDNRCAGMVRAFDACGIAPGGFFRDNALTECREDPDGTLWTCLQSCYTLYTDCSAWTGCSAYCSDENGADDDDDTWWDDDTGWDDDTWWDDDTGWDDDTWGDDDSWIDDDDSTPYIDCEGAMFFIYEDCGMTFFDEDENEIPIDEVIDFCWLGMEPYPDAAWCALDNMPDCDAAFECIEALFKGGAA
jgi:hypothetical protein